jgi:nickel-dependent lactate racemase
MKIRLSYGYEGLEVEINENNLLEVIESKGAAPIQDPKKALIESFSNPIGSISLKEKIKSKQKICIVISDSTRAVPTKFILEALLGDLAKYKIKKDQITILIATGLHRPNLDMELENLVGKQIKEEYRIVNHYAKKRETCEFIGKTKRGTPIIIDKAFLDCDFRILTGLIEPHFMAGFSGGRKAICPGISYMDMFKHFHGPAILESLYASNANLKNNPFHLESTEIAKKAGVDFIVNVTIDKDKKITGIFSGDLEEAFNKGALFCSQTSCANIRGEADIVVTTGGGLPLDATFYQAVKGMVAAMPAVKKNGMIVIASECKEEIGSDEFVELSTLEENLDEFMEKIKKPDYFKIDQWQLEELVKARRKAEIYLYSSCMLASRHKIPEATVRIVNSVEDAIKIGLEKFGSNATINVIPEGPYTVPVLKK